MSTVFEIIGAVVIFIVVVLAIYLPVDRICKCIENCALFKAYGLYAENVSNGGAAGDFLTQLLKNFAKNGGEKGCNDEKS